ncbi:MAG: PepSY domain-containing protein [Phycisphaerae bacterium]|nr:PepSY domain-containing protein [Gemmatimonadaceae bacterium]
MTAVATEPSRTQPPASTAAPTLRERRPLRPLGRGPLAVARSVMFWAHVAMGTVGGIIILIMSVTGVLLGFERQLIARFDGVARAVPRTASARRMPLDSLLGRAGIEFGAVASITAKAGPTEPVTVRFRERDRTPQLFDPYTGMTIAPVPRGKMAASMSLLRGWHRWLGATGEHRPLMRKLTGAANIAFLLLVFSGLYIWWPKRLSKAAFKTAAVFNPRLGGKARDFNWHNSLGFWSAVPLAFVIATGVFISYSWPGQWMDRLFGSAKERAAAIKAMNAPPPAGGAGEAAGNASPNNAQRAQASRDNAARDTSNNASTTLAPLGAMFATVAAAKPDWQSLTITTPSARDSVVQFAVAEGNTYRPDLKTQYFFSAATGVQTRVTNFDSLSTSRKIRGWTRFGHTGEVFGLPGQFVATFVSFIGVMLVWTGLALAWRRLVAFTRRRRRSALVV